VPKTFFGLSQEVEGRSGSERQGPERARELCAPSRYRREGLDRLNRVSARWGAKSKRGSPFVPWDTMFSVQRLVLCCRTRSLTQEGFTCWHGMIRSS
jgi:hypothetical protein